MLKVFLCSKKSLGFFIFYHQKRENIRFSNGMRIDYSLTNVRKIFYAILVPLKCEKF